MARFKNMEVRPFVLASALAYFLLLIVFFSTSRSWFVIESPRYDVSAPLRMQTGATYRQSVTAHGDGELTGFSVRFGTYGKEDAGTLDVAFLDGDEPVQEWSFNTATLLDNEYRYFEFDTPLAAEPESGYSIEITLEDMVEDGGLSLSMSAGGSMFSSTVKDEYRSTLCHTISWFDRGQWLRFSIPAAIILSALILLAVLPNFDAIASMDRVRSLVAVAGGTVFLLLFGVFVGDLVGRIRTDIPISPRAASSSPYEIEPSGNYSGRLSIDAAEVHAFEFYVDSRDCNAVRIIMADADTGEVLLDRVPAIENMLEGGPSGYNAIRIDARESGLAFFPKSKYDVTVINLSEKQPLNLLSGVYEKDSVEYLNVSQWRTTRMGYRLALAFSTLLLLYPVILLGLACRKAISPASFFLATFLTIGLVYFFVMLPWSHPDALPHFLATYRLSNLLLGFSGPEQYLGRANDVSFLETVWAIWSDVGEGNRVLGPDMQDYLLHIYNLGKYPASIEMVPWPDTDEGAVLTMQRMSGYSIFSYLPAVAGMTLGRLIRLDSVSLMYFSRLVVFVAYGFGCHHAIKRTPIGGFALMVTALLPNALQMSSSFSYDAAVIIVSLNFIASSLSLLEGWSAPHVIEAAVWTALLGAVKGGGYLLLLPLLAIMALDADKSAMRRAVALMLAGIAAAVLFDLVLADSSSLTQFGSSETPRMSASLLFSDPGTFFKLLFLTLHRSIDVMTLDIGGTWLSCGAVLIPRFYIVGMFFAAWAYSCCEVDVVSLGHQAKVPVLASIGASFLLTPIMLFSYTPLGSQVIRGIQGRYYLPIYPLIILALSKFDLRADANTPESRRVRTRAVLALFLLFFLSTGIVFRQCLIR